MYPKYSHCYGISDILYTIAGFFVDFGPALKKEIRKIFGVNHVLFLDSGRAVLDLGLKTLLEQGKLKEGNEVAIPVDLCMVAVEPIIKNGLKPLIIDINTNLTMDADDLKKKRTLRTKAVMPVYNYGNVPDMDEIISAAKWSNAVVIEDMAPTFNARYKGKTAGSFGLFGFISLDATKHISAFNGGILLTNDDEFYRLVKEKALRNGRERFFDDLKRFFKLIAFIIATNNMVYGLITKNFISSVKKASFYKPKGMLLSKAAIALAYSQVKKIEKINSIKKSNAQQYMAVIGEKRVASNLTERKPTFQFLPVLVENRNKIVEYLEKEKKIIDFPRPVPLLTHVYEYQAYHKPCPKAEELRKKLLLLPTYRKINKITPKLCNTINKMGRVK